MKFKVCLIYDSKAEVYTGLNLFRNHNDAIRHFTTGVNDASCEYSRYTEDYILFSIGDYDQLTGEIVPYPKQHIADLINLKQVREEPDLGTK